MLAISLTVFLLGTYGPGDPIRVRLGVKATDEAVARLRAEMGLDRPVAEQYINYVANALQGEFGESIKYTGVSVTDLISERIWVSTQLALITTLTTFMLGIPIGVLAALYQGRWADRLIVTLALIPQAFPTFVVVPVVFFIFVRTLHWFPSSGWDGIFSNKIVLPVFVMSITGLTGLLRQMRTSTLDVLFADYIRTARAKGLRETTVMRRHVLRNALLPIWTLTGFVIADLPAGALIVEGLFGIPGVGQLAWDSIFARDYPVIQAITLLGAFMYVIGNLVVDLGYPFFDPRIRVEG